MLFSLGRRIVYGRETRTRKSTPKPDALSQWRTMEVQRNHVTWMENFRSKRDGVLPVESRRAGGVPGPVPQKDPPKATGGHPVPMRGARLRKRRVNATGQKSPNHSKTIRPLSILQWNAEGVFNNMVPLTDRLHKEDVDVACIQETRLNTNHRFSIRGYQTFRLDREGRHKGGVLILVRNNIAASDFKVDTNQQAEIHGVKITVDNSAINIFNLYCPSTPPPPPPPPPPTKTSPFNIYMCHHKTAWLLVTSTATQRPGAMARLTVEETKWRTGR